jgi:biopolymer transport protein ExbD
MKERRTNKLLIEPPASATGDIAFNLIIFFLVCASVQPDSGRSQTIPRSDDNQQEQQQDNNIEVTLTPKVVLVDGKTVLKESTFLVLMQAKLRNKTREEDRVVIVKSETNTPYFRWIRFTEQIELAGGIITIQTEEETVISQ